MFLNLGLTANVVLFATAALVVGVCGVQLTEKAESLARVTGLGQAIIGAVVLGALTSLAGTITSVTSAWSGAAELAFGNAIGGIAAQTTFLVIADALYRKVNLEHAAASEENLMQGVLLVVLLAIPLLGIAGPGLTLWSVDLTSLAIFAAYLFGIRLLTHAHRVPMWYPRPTSATAQPKTETADTRPLEMRELWIKFLLLATAVAFSGWVIARTGIALTRQTGVSETLVGTLLTSVVTSLPELVIAITAVKRGALTLAVGDILGGNTFDVLFLVLSDIAYRAGSIYQAVSMSMVFWLALNILLTGILLTGMLRRERKGPLNIGFEGVLVLAVYLSAVTLLFLQ